MSNISINYILLQDNDKNILQKMVNACKSEKHNISLVLNDFSLDKQIENTVKEINPSNISLSVVKHDYEDSKNATENQKLAILVMKQSKLLSDTDLPLLHSPPIGGQTAFVLNKHLSDCRLTAKGLEAT